MGLLTQCSTSFYVLALATDLDFAFVSIWQLSLLFFFFLSFDAISSFSLISLTLIVRVSSWLVEGHCGGRALYSLRKVCPSIRYVVGFAELSGNMMRKYIMTLRLISHHIHPHIHTYTHTHIHTYTHTHAHPFPVDSIDFFFAPSD